MLTVMDALKIESLKNTRLVAGKNGIDKVIKSVTVMEVPDIVKWLKGGEFIITRFYSLKDNVQEQINILYELNRLNASGIAIKLTDSITSIDEKFIKAADEINFPVVEIQESLTFLDIMTPLNHAIFELEQHFRLVEEYIKAIVFHTYNTTEFIVERGKTLGCDIEKGFIYTISIDVSNFSVSKKQNVSKYNSISIKDEVSQFIDNIISSFKREKKIINYMIIRNIEDITLFIQTENKISAERYGKYVLDLILKHRNLYYKYIGMTIGIGSTGEGISGIENGYDQAKYAIKIGQVVNKSQDYYFYKNIEIYSLFYKNSFDTLSSFTTSTLGKVVNDIELIDTLSMYFECNENIMITSEKLFIHKNTLKYRLDRIKKITELDIKKIDDKVKLYFAVIAYNVVNKKSKD